MLWGLDELPLLFKKRLCNSHQSHQISVALTTVRPFLICTNFLMQICRGKCNHYFSHHTVTLRLWLLAVPPFLTLFFQHVASWFATALDWSLDNPALALKCFCPEMALILSACILLAISSYVAMPNIKRYEDNIFGSRKRRRVGNVSEY